MRSVMRDKDVHSVAHHPDLARAAEAMKGSKNWGGGRKALADSYQKLLDGGKNLAGKVKLSGVPVHHMHYKAIYPTETLNPHDLLVAGDRHTDAHRASGGSPVGKNKSIYKEMSHMTSGDPRVREQMRDYYYTFNKNSQMKLGEARDAMRNYNAATRDGSAVQKGGDRGAPMRQQATGDARSRDAAPRPNSGGERRLEQRTIEAERRAFAERARKELAKSAIKQEERLAQEALRRKQLLQAIMRMLRRR
jgi:hypothetical protein